MKHLESAEQIAGMDWLRLQHPILVEYTMHIPNERKTSWYMGSLLKSMGVLKGTSDLFIAWPVKDYAGLWIEVKSKKGRLSPEQKSFIERMNRIGYFASVAYGADQIIDTIKWYLSLEGQPVI